MFKTVLSSSNTALP